MEFNSKNKTILLTGGAGFIGSNLVRLLIEKTTYNIVNIDKLTYAGNLSNLQDFQNNPRHYFVEGDITDYSLFQGLLKKYEAVGVINLAAESHVDRSIDGPKDFIESNYLGVFNLLEVSKKYYSDASQQIKKEFRFLQVSTDEVYGSLGETGSFSETTPYAPTSPYSASKAGADHLVNAYFHTYGLPTMITNCSNNYGPYQFPEKLIPLMILNAIEGKSLPIYGKGLNVRDWLYVEDHCSGILRVFEKGSIGEQYNIGTKNEKTNIQIVDKICDILNEKNPPAMNPMLKHLNLKDYKELKKFVADRPGHDLRYAINPEKITSQLGWKPHHDFNAGLEKTVQWYLDHEDWCADIKTGKYQRERLGLNAQATVKNKG